MGKQNNKKAQLFSTSNLKELLAAERDQLTTLLPLAGPPRRDVIIPRRQERAGFPAEGPGSGVSDGFSENGYSCCGSSVEVVSESRTSPQSPASSPTGVAVSAVLVWAFVVISQCVC